MKNVAIIQARMGSTRLPGKVMLKLGEHSVLGHVITRLQLSKGIDEIWVATSNKEADHAIHDEAAKYDALVYRGDESDVLDRYYQTAILAKADRIIRVTSDCPFIDSQIVDELIDLFNESNYEYGSNTLERSYPRGLDCEIFTFESLETSWTKADQYFQREHVTPYMYQNREVFKVIQMMNSTDCSAHRWTLDTREDWTFIQTVYEKGKAHNLQLDFHNILKLLELYPEIVNINAHIEQKKLGE